MVPCKDILSYVICILLYAQAALMKDAAIAVNRCLWSPDGTILGIKVVHFSANSIIFKNKRHLAIIPYFREFYFRLDLFQ